MVTIFSIPRLKHYYQNGSYNKDRIAKKRQVPKIDKRILKIDKK